MRADSSAFAAYNTAASKRPRVVIELAFDTANTDLLYLTSHPDTDLPAGAVSGGVAIEDVVNSISGFTQKINPDQANSTIGAFSFALADVDSAVTSYLNTKLVAGDGLRGKRMRVYVGYQGMLWADYQRVLTYVIEGMTYRNGAYTIKAGDIQREVRKDIFNPAVTYLTKSVTANQGHIPCLAASTSLFPTVAHDSSYTVHASRSVNYVMIEDECIAHEGLFTHGTDGISFRVLAEHTGTHTGSNNAATLTYSSGTWTTNALVGLLIENTTDGSTGTITANTATTVTATLSGGTDNDWDTGDAFKIYTGRGALNTRAAEHVMDSSAASERRLKITEHVFFEGPAPKIIYALLTGHLAENLFTYSADFTNAAWTDPSAEWTVTGNTDVAPDGTTTADEITVTSAGNALIRYVPSPSIAGGGTYTVAVWARIKSGTVSSGLGIDLGDGTQTVTELTGQWQRVVVTGASHASNNWVDLQIIGASAGATVLLWGAQLSATAGAVPYYPTTSSARSAQTLPSNWHLGISAAYVDADDFYNIGADLWNVADNTGRHVRFEGVKKQDGKKFIETELLYWLGCFMPVYASGELGLRRLASVLSSAGHVAVLDETNISDYGDLTHDMRAVLNQVVVNWNYVFAKDDSTKTTALIDATSIATHQDAPVKTINLRGVHTGAHTDEDIASYFDTLRDRYSGPPLRLSVTVAPSLNRLEVGNTVRVKLPQVRDFVTGTTLDRVFEIQQVQMDWLAGDVKLELFASSQKAGAISRTAASAVLDDAFYNSAGTELSTVLSITAGAVTADGSLTGGETLADGIYYYLGDLTINADVTVTISDNVQLRVRGHLTINGTINGKGQGHAGGAGASLWENGTASTTQFWLNPVIPKTNIGLGTPGYIGNTKSAGFTKMWEQSAGMVIYSENSPPVIAGNISAVPFINVKNADTALNGLPADLRGTSGTGGGCVCRITGLASGYYTWSLVGAGGNGGNGGAGLVVISRGMSYGVAGAINLSGNDGALGAAYTYGSVVFHAGSGGGGAPGGFALLLDGNHTPPELVTELVQLHGDSPIVGTPLAMFNGSANNFGANNYPHFVGLSGFDFADSAYTLQYIPEYNPAEEELPPPPPNVTGLAASNDGLHARVTWNALADSSLVYRVKRGTSWGTATFLADVKATEYKHLMATQDTYDFMVAAVDVYGQESQTPASGSVSGAPAVSYDSNFIGADDYLSAVYFYRNIFETLDGITSSNSSLVASSGSVRLSGTTFTCYKTVNNAHNTLSFVGYNWRFKSIFSIASGTGQYLGTGNAFYLTCSGSAAMFGIRCRWNSGTSMIDIYGLSQTGSSISTLSLITSVADTGVLIYVEAIYTSGTSVYVVLTIGGVEYSVTITTNLPNNTAVYFPMQIIGGVFSNTVTVDVYDYVVIKA